MIGLESNLIRIDIHESKVPVNLRPEFVEVYHNGKLVHNGKISYDCKPGEVTIDVGASKKNFDDVLKSPGSYIPFKFNFLAYSTKMKILYTKGIWVGDIETHASIKPFLTNFKFIVYFR